jgi:phenylacetic acid degradation operon negative regulatory protein
MKPRSLMFTLFGDFIKHYGGEVWIGSLIRMMNEFGISESSVRGATLRMVQQDLLEVRRVGNKSYYTLTDSGNRRLEDGVRRVYAIRNHKWDGVWRILTYSVPEEKRDLRNQIRQELVWTGFGLLSNSVWVSPNPLEKQIMDMIKTYHLEPYTILFSSTSVVSHSDQEVVEKGWNLNEISEEYDQFINKYQEKYDEFKEKIWNGTISDSECFIWRTNLVHEYRKFLFKDPGFPLDILPANWSGIKARELFWNIHQLISVPAVRHFEILFETIPDKNENFNREKAINPFSDMYVNQ